MFPSISHRCRLQLQRGSSVFVLFPYLFAKTLSIWSFLETALYALLFENKKDPLWTGCTLRREFRPNVQLEICQVALGTSWQTQHNPLGWISLYCRKPGFKDRLAGSISSSAESTTRRRARVGIEKKKTASSQTSGPSDKPTYNVRCGGGLRLWA